MNKKIIIIRNAYSHDFGGGERFPVFLAESLSKQACDPVIISRNPRLLELARQKGLTTIRGWWWSNQRWNGWRVLLFPVYVGWQIILYFWYRQLFSRLRPDVIHIQSKDDFIAATYAARHSGAFVVWTDHADLKHVWRNLSTKLKNPIGKWIYHTAIRTNAITVVSKSELNEVCSHLPTKSFVKDRISVIYNGCEDVRSNYPYKSGEDVTFVIASRLVTDKGISEAIDAFRNLQNKHKDVRLIIAGDGPEKDKFIYQAIDLPQVSFTGHQPDPYAVISQADIFLQPTYHEGFSVVLVEASMLERAIIATDVGGNREIIHDHETGLLVPPKDSVLLANAMELLYRDSDLRTKIAKNARKQYVQLFVFDTIVKERFMPLYDKTTD